MFFFSDPGGGETVNMEKVIRLGS